MLGSWDLILCTTVLVVPLAHWNWLRWAGSPTSPGLLVYFQWAIWVHEVEFGYWTPSLAWRFFCGSVMFSGPSRNQPTLLYLWSWFSSLWTSHVCGLHLSIVPFACQLSMLSASALIPKSRLELEGVTWVKHSSFNCFFIWQTCISHQGCRDEKYMDSIFKEFKLWWRNALSIRICHTSW